MGYLVISCPREPAQMQLHGNLYFGVLVVQEKRADSAGVLPLPCEVRAQACSSVPELEQNLKSKVGRCDCAGEIPSSTGLVGFGICWNIIQRKIWFAPPTTSKHHNVPIMYPLCRLEGSKAGTASARRGLEDHRRRVI